MNPYCLCLALSTLAFDADSAKLKEALTFHVSFDKSADADFALGDPKIYTGLTDKRLNPKPGIHGHEAEFVADQGHAGGAMRLGKKTDNFLFYRAEKNIHYRKNDWSGTVSFWLRLDPDSDLEPGFADPIQITEKQWDNAALFVDFTRDDKPRHFRLGVFSDYKEWNPTARDWDSIPPSERPMVDVAKPPFSRDKWTNIVMTFEKFNTGKPNAVAKLYLDGEYQGTLADKVQTFTWEPSKAAIMVGLYYIGLYDDLSLFNRALTDAEVKTLFSLPAGVSSLHK